MAKTCNNCNSNDMAVMPIAQHEKDQNRLWSIIKWLIVANVIIFLVAVATNIFWIYKDNQYKDVETITEETYEVDASDGGNAVYNEDGSVNING